MARRGEGKGKRAIPGKRASADSAMSGPLTIDVPLVDPDWYLAIERGSRAGQRFPLLARTTIGREEDNHLVLEDDLISRHHAVLERHGGRYVLRDLGSKLGTSLNGEHVPNQAPVVNGDEIVLGVTSLRVVGPPDPTAVEPVVGAAPMAQSLPPSVPETRRRVPATRPGTDRCRTCGRRIDSADKFCGSCGARR